MSRLAVGVADVHVIIIIHAILFSRDSLSFGAGILFREGMLVPFLSILVRFRQGCIAWHAMAVLR